jgi:hypothetical protein
MTFGDGCEVNKKEKDPRGSISLKSISFLQRNTGFCYFTAVLRPFPGLNAGTFVAGS